VEPQLSVVLPVLNEAADLERLLAELRDQDLASSRYEVLVADGGSTDGTREIVTRMAASWPGLVLLDNPGRRSAPARNLGARRARGAYVLFVDGHCAIGRRDFLRRVLEVFAATGADCLARPQPLSRLARGPWGEAIALARHSRLGHDPGSDIYGREAARTDPRSAGAAYRRTVLERLGGFDERFDACEDVELNHRVAESGYVTYVHPDLAVDYRPRDGLAPFWKQMLRYGRGRGRLFVRHPRLAPWPILAASALGLAGLATALAGGPTGAWIGAAALAFWVGLLAFEGCRLAGPSRGALRVAVALGAIQAGLVLGFWRGLLEFRAFRAPARAPRVA
jgi:prepilin-type processing-associated H-X9-DG protein